MCDRGKPTPPYGWGVTVVLGPDWDELVAAGDAVEGDVLAAREPLDDAAPLGSLSRALLKSRASRSALWHAEGVLPSCSICGATADDWIAEGWAVTKDGDRTTYLCVECARENIRAIEGKLPEEYWR